ncbi:hypothetical protein R1sor_021799 [Riccia sorocarpa]|uniref:Uncharacterized protein n=1 Tax=Riccia sorocarpa TaxID=122646 RepID=A0ABD3GI37_9MARC
MQAHVVLRYATSQKVTHGSLPSRCSSRRSQWYPYERKRGAVIIASRKKPQTVRFLAELQRKDSNEGPAAELRAEQQAVESSPLVNSEDSTASPSSSFMGSSEQNTYSSTGTAVLPPIVMRQINFTDRHLLLLGLIACATTGALSCILLAAIPTLIAFKKAADSLKKLADTTREELPGTMAAVRLSGMEISDLTMELSDLGQEISEGVRSSTRAVRAAEDGLRRMGSFTSIAMLQERATDRVQVVRPKVALAARSTREALVRARSLLRGLVTLTRLSTWLAQRWRMIRPLKQRSISSRAP